MSFNLCGTAYTIKAGVSYGKSTPLQIDGNKFDMIGDGSLEPHIIDRIQQVPGAQQEGLITSVLDERLRPLLQRPLSELQNGVPDNIGPNWTAAPHSELTENDGPHHRSPRYAGVYLSTPVGLVDEDGSGSHPVNSVTIMQMTDEGSQPFMADVRYGGKHVVVINSKLDSLTLGLGNNDFHFQEVSAVYDPKSGDIQRDTIRERYYFSRYC